MTAQHSETSNSPLQRIRFATWSRHQRIEQCAVLKRLFSKQCTLADYAAVLAKLYGFYSVTEPLLTKLLADEAEPIFHGPSKTALLVSDLQMLGYWPPLADRLPACQNLPVLVTVDDAIGMAYVMEGATLGGHVISQHLARHFGTMAQPALQFYGCYGEATETHWLTFKQVLNQRYANNETGLAALIASVDATYLSLTDWFEWMA